MYRSDRNAPRLRPTSKLIRKIDRAYKVLIKATSSSTDKTLNTISTVADNFHLIKRSFSEATASLASIKKIPFSESGVPDLYEHLYDFCRYGEHAPSVSGINILFANIKEKTEVSFSEAAVALAMLKACCIEIISNCITADLSDGVLSVVERQLAILRVLRKSSFPDISEKLCRCEDMLLADKVYSSMDKRSKAEYRYRIEKRAYKEKKSEASILSDVLSKASGYKVGAKSHFGYWLFERKKYHYLEFCLALTVVAAIGLSIIFRTPLLGILSILPLYYIVKYFLDLIYSYIVRSEYVPRIELKESAPKTLVSIVTILNDTESIDRTVAAVEKMSVTNRMDGFTFGILADFGESDTLSTEKDGVLLTYLDKRIRELESRRGAVTFCAVRKRVYNSCTNLFEGRERKRGAVCDFLTAVANGNTSAFDYYHGNTDGAVYFTTLDGDTMPEIGAIKKLVGVLEHPFAHPIISDDGLTVSDGYGIAVPRMELTAASWSNNLFTRIFGGDGGSDVYSDPTFSVYQDLYGEGIFAGKGVIRISTFLQLLSKELPDNRVLSHDAVESGYLRTVYVSDTVFYDTMPQNIISYLKRAHRWIRGDVQNTIFIGRYRLIGGRKENPLSTLTRYKLLDNVGRSILPIVNVSLILIGVLDPVFAIIPIAEIFSVFFFSRIRKLFMLAQFRQVWYGISILPSVTRSFLHCVSELALLPAFAYNSLDAVTRSVWRMIRRDGARLMEWTTAFDADKQKTGWRALLRVFLPQTAGILLLFDTALFRLGIIWLLGLPLIWFYTQNTPKKQMRKNADQISVYLKDMWRFYADHITAENNYLPPDNYQEEPLAVSVKRTSPTNIGLSALAIRCGYHVGLIDADNMYDILNKMFSNIEALPKYRGNLYNWYDISTLSPLSPRFISFVDSGNFAVSLDTVRNMLADDHDVRAERLIRRISRILSDMDLSFMFDNEAGLFHIGYDTVSEKLTDGHYDLYAGEATLSSYYCIAKGIVSEEHWEKLDRAICEKYCRMYVKSWTGTAFEYFLQTIFLPVREYTFNSEMLKSCFYAQRCKNRLLPWGNSESGYYLFDTALYYQYKAFGVQRLAFKRGMDNENVVSPYSSFLMLPFYPKSVLRNLNKLKDYAMYGKYGFYEALDATFARVGKDPAPVKMYMSHHLSMSFLSAVNYLNDNIVVRSFFRGDNSYYSELLEEKLPATAISIDEVNSREKKDRVIAIRRDLGFIDIENPLWTAIGNKTVTSVMNDLGVGYWDYQGMRVTRHRRESHLNASEQRGIFAAVRVNDSILSATMSPIYDSSATYKTAFGISSVSYKAKKGDIETVYDVTVAPNSNCEIRELTVKNISPVNRDAEIIFYFEPILTEAATEESHPAFSGLFIEGIFDGSSNILSMYRRQRNDKEKGMAMSVTMFDSEGREQLFEYELSRFNVLSSCGITSFINAFDAEMSSQSDKTVYPIDPCVCIRTQICMAPYGSESVYLVTSANNDVDSAKAHIMRIKTSNLHNTQESLKKLSLAMLSEIHADRESLNLSNILLSAIAAGARDVAYSIDFPSPINNMYKYGLSGELPFIFVMISPAVTRRADTFIKAFLILKKRNIRVEILFGYRESDVYFDRIGELLANSVVSFGGKEYLNRKDGVLIRKIESTSDFDLLRGICCFYADLEKGWKPIARKKRNELATVERGKPIRLRYSYKTGIGGYARYGDDVGFGIDDSSEFDSMPPWCHVIANPRFGTLISHKNLGFTYAENSALKRLTPFRNDALSDGCGENLLIKYGGTLYDVIKGSSSFFMKGQAAYETDIAGIRVRVNVFVCVSLPIKIVNVKLDNTSNSDLEVYYNCDVILGERKKYEIKQKIGKDHIEYYDPYTNSEERVILYAKNAVTSKNGISVVCKGGNSLCVSFCLCYAASANRKKGLLELLSKDDFPDKEKEYVGKYWDSCGRVQIKTPDPTLDLFFNGFLQYQIKAARLFAKTGFYQCSGAFGFRDQLQDAMSLSITESKLLKKQILLACGRQFVDGDVLHWWHDDPKCGIIRGTRTRSSDDILWLPFAVAKYVKRTAESNLLKKDILYIEGRRLNNDETEAYIECVASSVAESVYEHCKKAIVFGIKKGRHGLILFGGGDWNDGMNRVGIKGKGETVWGSFFAIMVLELFAPLAKSEGDYDFADFCRKEAADLRQSVERFGWDGKWYKRGYFDNGSALGTSDAEEGKIDLIPQAFASLCGGFDPSRVRSGLESAERLLIDRETKLVKLLSPPYNSSENDPGYIMSYVPGVRENGGQYTHAAVWYAAALIKDCQYEKAYDIIALLNPVNRIRSIQDVYKYRVEPYVLAGDVYSTPDHEGMGGWTHYTGSAGWYFSLVIEEMLGIKIRGDRLIISPSLPAEWKEYRAVLNIDKGRLDILVRKATRNKITVDRQDVDKIILDGNSHEIVYQYTPI